MRGSSFRVFCDFKNRQFLKQMKAIIKTQKYLLCIALGILVIYPASVLSQIAVYDFNSDDEEFTVETVGAVPGPWEYDEENGQWVSAGSVAGCGGPYHDFLTSPDCIVAAAGEVSLSVEHRHAFEADMWDSGQLLSLIHISEPTRQEAIS